VGVFNRALTATEVATVATANAPLDQVVVNLPTGWNALPTVALTAPNTAITSGTSVALSSSASDTDGSIAKVEFLVNGVRVGEDTSAPYSWSWTPTKVGSHTVSARAFDNKGASVDSAVVTLTANATLQWDPAQPSLTEGGQASLRVRLASNPGANVSVTAARVSGDTDLTVSATPLRFTAANWNVYQAVSIAAAEDNTDTANDAATVRFSGDWVESAERAVTALDNDVTLGVDTAGAGTYTSRIVTKSAATTVTSAAAPAGRHFTGWTVVNGSAVIASSSAASTTVTATSDARIKANFASDIAIVASPAPVSVPEGGNAVFNVTLAADPGADVVVSVARVSGDSDVTVSAGQRLTFSRSNWNRAQTVTLTAAQDNADSVNGAAVVRLSGTWLVARDVTVSELDDDVTLGVDAAGSGAFTNRMVAKSASTPVTAAAAPTGKHFTGWTVVNGSAVIASGSAASTTVTATSDARVKANFASDIAIVVNPDPVIAPEGRNTVFNVSLASDPGVRVAVDVAWLSGDKDISVSAGQTLTFTSGNWRTPQPVTVAVAADRDALDGRTVLRLSGPRLVRKDLTVTEADSELSAVPSAVTVTLAEDGKGTFQVTLNRKPSATVTVNVARFSGDSDIAVSAGGKLVFTAANWNVAQTVELTAAGDADADNGSAKILLSGEGLVDRDVTAVETDSDLGVAVERGSVSVPEGGSAPAKVRLNLKPAGNVTVDVSMLSGDADITLAGPVRLVFTPENWNVYQSVGLNAAEDADADAGRAEVLLSPSAGVVQKKFTAVEGENEVTVATNVTAPTVPEGGRSILQTKLTIKPTTDVVVSVSKVAGGDADLSVSGGSVLRFTPANWNVYQDVTFAASEDSDLVNGEATYRFNAPNMVSKDVIVREVDNDTVAILVDRQVLTVTEDGGAIFQIKLAKAPKANTTVSVRRVGGDGDLNVLEGASVVFTPADFNQWKPVKLGAAWDADTVSGTATFACSSSGLSTVYLIAYEAEIPALAAKAAPAAKAAAASAEVVAKGVDPARTDVQGYESTSLGSVDLWFEDGKPNADSVRILKAALPGELSAKDFNSVDFAMELSVGGKVYRVDQTTGSLNKVPGRDAYLYTPKKGQPVWTLQFDLDAGARSWSARGTGLDLNIHSALGCEIPIVLSIGQRKFGGVIPVGDER
jgi:hypothetical protein